MRINESRYSVLRRFWISEYRKLKCWESKKFGSHTRGLLAYTRVCLCVYSHVIVMLRKSEKVQQFWDMKTGEFVYMHEARTGKDCVAAVA